MNIMLFNSSISSNKNIQNINSINNKKEEEIQQQNSKPKFDEYISNKSQNEESIGIYKIEQDKNGERKITFENDKKSQNQNAEKNENQKPEILKCAVNSDKVLKEIEKLKKEKQSLEQKIAQCKDNPEKLKELQNKLKLVNNELKLKDNDNYIKQNSELKYEKVSK